jgi:hypothetical protein
MKIKVQLHIYKSMQISPHDKRVPVTMTWRVLRLWMEERPPIWRVAVNILNKESTRGGLPAWGLGEVLKTPHRKNRHCYET